MTPRYSAERALGELLAAAVVAVAWCIPGPPHRWAVRLRAERLAGAKFGPPLEDRR